MLSSAYQCGAYLELYNGQGNKINIQPLINS